MVIFKDYYEIQDDVSGGFENVPRLKLLPWISRW